MKTVLFLVRKYLILSKSNQAINWLSLITMISMAVGSAALIIVLSVFNGFESLAIGLYESFEPELTAMPKRGTTMSITYEQYDSLLKLPSVEAVSMVYETKAYLKYSDRETIGIIKGVDHQYFKTNDLKRHILAGDTILEDEENSFGILGIAVADQLKIDLNNPLLTIEVYVPKSESNISLSGSNHFEKSFVIPQGIFSIYQEYDEKYIIVPLSLVQYLTQTDESTCTAIEFKLKGSESEALPQIQKVLGDQWKFNNRLQKNETLYKLTRIEKSITFIVMSFILFILSLNFIGSLTMHLIQKRNDLFTLRYIGIKSNHIRWLYLALGVSQGVLGGIIGLTIGILILLGQKTFGWVGMPGSGTFVVSAYPVELRLFDIISIVAIVVIMSFLMSLLPAHNAQKVK